MRTIAIGDVHGCVDELRELLRLVEYRQGDDDVIVVGDLVDRGPDSVGVIAACMELGVRAIMGNHDEKHVRNARNLARHPDSRVGFRSDEERGMWAHMTDAQREWLSSLPDYARLGPRLVAVHAGMLPGIPLEGQPQRALHRLRYVEWKTRKDGTQAWEQARMKITDDDGFLRPRGSRPWYDVYDGTDDVVYGHWARDHAEITYVSDVGTCFGIDTGACFGGRLTAIIFSEPMSNGRQPWELAEVQSKFTDHRETFYEGEYDP